MREKNKEVIALRLQIQLFNKNKNSVKAEFLFFWCQAPQIQDLNDQILISTVPGTKKEGFHARGVYIYLPNIAN
jgi:hypothetical protein